ncbi:MAG: hypothetical protein KAT77_04800 [Nanoarchaeota archaeon]|nr:hypothetical protein [Nanoarchaeota archaeon]
MKQIAVLGDLELVLGMKLAGASKCLNYQTDKAAEQVNQIKEFPILITTETIAAELKEKKLFQELQGVVVQVPDKSGSRGLALKQVSKLFEDALGLKIENQ